MTMKNLRWWVIALIALATIINYIDRQTLNVLWPQISAELYPDKSDDERKEIYAFISVVFVFSYAFGQALHQADFYRTLVRRTGLHAEAYPTLQHVTRLFSITRLVQHFQRSTAGRGAQ